MTPEKLDIIFPYFCFAYGALMTFTLNHASLMRIAEERLSVEWLIRFRAHRALGLICLAVGSLWILQNLWLT
jgi:predicted acyltransferase